MWAAVPLKSPEHAKTRLAGTLNPAQRRQLLFTLAERVIRALQATRGIDNVAVITASAEVAAFAQRLGAQAILQRAAACTASAFAAAVRQLEPLQLPRLLMIAGDLPLVLSAALERLLAIGGTAPGAVMVPDRHRVGTNALLCAPPQALAPCFGDDSFRRHLAAAERAGVRARTIEIEELALDLDCAEDFDELSRRTGMTAASLFETLRGADTERSRREARPAPP
jgi:2-phospho-L-lactate guanylyltransferase